MALMSTLIESFSSPTINSSLWTSSGVATAVTQPSGQLKFNTTTSSGYSSYQTINTYDLTGNYACVEIVDAGNQSLASLEVYPLQIEKDTSNIVYFLISGNFLRAYKKIAGTSTQLASIAYNNATMRFLRIREQSGTTYWEYSSNRTAWTTLFSVANPIVVTAVKQEFSVGTYSNEASSTTVLLDNFNYYTRITYGTFISYSDPNAVYTTPSNAVDIDTTSSGPNISTYAETTSVTSSGTTNYLMLTNPNMSSFSNVVLGVRMRVYGQARGTGSDYVYIEPQGTGNGGVGWVYQNTVAWSNWLSCTAPTSSGWTTASLSGLGAKCYVSGPGTTNTGKIYGVQVEYTIIVDKISDFVDQFIGTTIDTNKWTLSSLSAGSTISQNNKLYLYEGGGSSDFAGITSKYFYDLSNSSFYFQTSSDYSAAAYLWFGTNDRLQIFINSTSIQLMLGTATHLASYSLPNGNPIYVKIREFAGTLYMDTSPDNITYTNRGSVVLSTYNIDFTANPMKLWFYVNNGGSF